MSNVNRWQVMAIPHTNLQNMSKGDNKKKSCTFYRSRNAFIVKWSSFIMIPVFVL